jgi:NADPH:quinone reductase-like Zn-dependent oxidoreductase
MRAWEMHGSGGIDALVWAQRDPPRPGPGELRVRVLAASLNHRDLTTVHDPAARGITLPRIPGSDAAGEVVEVGEGVSRFRVGDRVLGCFFQRWVDGAITPEAQASALGGPVEGVFAEEVVLHEEGAVAIPPGLDPQAAATLPCAALTAWNSLVEVGGVRAGDTVLLLGTGGVSVFALQLAACFGARAIITSSRDDKLERARGLGATHTLNYRELPEWETEVLALTGGRGVDHVVEVGGPGTLARSIGATRVGGSIGLMGVLLGGRIDPTPVMRKAIRLQGVHVGSRAMLERLLRAVRHHGLEPVIDRRFPLDALPEALRHLAGASHFGKVVLTTG